METGDLIQKLDTTNSRWKSWQQPHDVELPADRIQALYEEGYTGAVYNKESVEQLVAESQFGTGDRVCSAFGYHDTVVKGRLIAPFTHVMEAYPGCWPGPGQGRGDCVSHGVKNSDLGTTVLESVLGFPDEVSGLLERLPVVSDEGIRNGVFSTETNYWFRGHNGDGWDCASAARVNTKYAGAVIRGPLEGTDIDLTRYSAKLAGKWGKPIPPQSIIDRLDNNLFRDAITVERDLEVVARLLDRGIFINSCGSEGFGNTRPTVVDENGNKCAGPNRVVKEWGHSMAYLAVDWRPEIIALFGEPLVLILNSWAIWNKGPLLIYGTDIKIPQGAFWAKWSDIRRRSLYATAGLNGWERKSLIDMDPGFV